MPSTLTLETFDPLDPTRRHLALAHLAVREAAGRADHGDRFRRYSLDELRADARPARQDRSEYVTALVPDGAGGARVVGTAVHVFPLLDNRNQTFADVWVLPTHRRRGIGSALIEHLVTRTRATGRSLITLESLRLLDRPDEASAFVARHGFRAALTDHRSDLDLPDDPAEKEAAVRTLLAPLDAEVAAADPASDHDLVTYLDEIPERWLAGRAVLEGRMSTDAPLGDLELEPEHWDGERLLESLARLRDAGRRLVETIAVQRSSGQVVGFTMLVVHPDHDGIAQQWNTLVLPEHRGRRLGMWIKAANLRALLAHHPRVRQIRTYNAEVNEPMLRVNRAMGFRAVAELTEWQRRLTPTP